MQQINAAVAVCARNLKASKAKYSSGIIFDSEVVSFDKVNYPKNDNKIVAL